MNDIIPQTQQFKRKIAYHFRVGEILKGNPILENERLKHVIINEKEIIRVNVIANIIDKFIQEGEKKFGSITLDDASGQIKAKVFGEDILKFSDFNQGDTVIIVGLLRYWNNEVYMTPEIIKKRDPKYLLIRKLERDKLQEKNIDPAMLSDLKEKMIQKIKKADSEGGMDIETLILELKEPPQTINKEIQKLLEDGMAYEPRPGKIRFLG
jgi:RecG-like helicase